MLFADQAQRLDRRPGPGTPGTPRRTGALRTGSRSRRSRPRRGSCACASACGTSPRTTTSAPRRARGRCARSSGSPGTCKARPSRREHPPPGETRSCTADSARSWRAETIRLAASIRPMHKGRLRKVIALDGRTLTLEAVERVAGGARCTLTAGARRAVTASRRAVERAVRFRAASCTASTPASATWRRSRIDERPARGAAGQPDPLARRGRRSAAARAASCAPILALRANCLARGHSGLRSRRSTRMLAMLARRHRAASSPSRDRVGASGDLAPLAHIALALIGEGEVALARAGDVRRRARARRRAACARRRSRPRKGSRSSTARR